MSDRKLGVHTSISGGLHLSLLRGHSLGCNTIQIFSHNPRGWSVKPISEEDIIRFRKFRSAFKISPVYIHTSYLINLASKDKMLRKKSIDMLESEMNIADMIRADFVVLHPGSSSGEDESVARRRVISSMNEVALRGHWNAGLLIENTAGERGDISSKVIDLSEILYGVKNSLLSGVCIDTCHAFSAGYDIRNNKGILKISRELEKHIGLDKIRLIHLNDSKRPVGLGIDRHEHIGLGKIGTEGLKKFINSSSLLKIPLILETPKKRESDDENNLRRVKRMIHSYRSSKF